VKKLDWSKIIHKPEEFDDPDLKGSYVYMSPRTILICHWLRKTTGWPMIFHNKYGLHGCVCMSRGHHTPNSYHNYDHPEGCSAVDFHFVTDTDPRIQAWHVIRSGFKGIGIYQNVWKWNNRTLRIGFHGDLRKHFQIWKLDPTINDYVYLLR